MAPEHVTGEVLEPAPAGSASFPIPQPQRKARQLSPQQFQAAVAEAGGLPRREIAKLIGVSESTIKNWRSEPEYQAEVERLQDRQAEMVGEAVAKMKEELTEGVRAAIRTLTLNLDAENDKGHPLWSTRKEAAELLLRHGIELYKESRTRGNDGPQAPTQATQIVIHTGDGPPDTTTVAQ